MKLTVLPTKRQAYMLGLQAGNKALRTLKAHAVKELNEDDDLEVSDFVQLVESLMSMGWKIFKRTDDFAGTLDGEISATYYPSLPGLMEEAGLSDKQIELGEQWYVDMAAAHSEFVAEYPTYTKKADKKAAITEFAKALQKIHNETNDLYRYELEETMSDENDEDS